MAKHFILNGRVYASEFSKKNYSQNLVPLEGMSDPVSRDEVEAGGSENFKPLLEAGDQPC